LHGSFPDRWAEIIEALRKFRISTRDIGMPGGNESHITKKFAKVLRDHQWRETRIKRFVSFKIQEFEEVIDDEFRSRRHKLEERTQEATNTHDAHKIDFVKDRVAIDFEWNSKDQTFDRDLFALQLFHETQRISVGVLVTRSEELIPLFPFIPRRNKTTGEIELENGQPVPVVSKYGATTTWIGKLIPRLNSGRHGACPVLVFAIRPGVILDPPDLSGPSLRTVRPRLSDPVR
jgi:CRISPR-associated protein Csd2